MVSRGAATSWRRTVWFAAMALCLGWTVRAAAQDKKDYALIYGTVWSADNHSMAGVPVKIQRVGDSKPKWSLVSDRRGEFAQRVPPGENDYVVIADVKVPKGGTKPQTKIHVQKNERVDLSLHLPK